MSVNATPFHFSKHLKTDEIIDYSERCPICLSKNQRKKIFKNQRSPDIYFLKCFHCYGVSASNMPKKTVLEDFYNTYYQNTNNEKLITFDSIKKFSFHILKYIDIKEYENIPYISILDFGGGDGSLSISLAKEINKKHPKLKIDILIVDYIKKEDYTQDNIEVKYSNNLHSLIRKYNIILASAIIEHIPDLNPILTQLNKLLKENGYFYARTPYVIPFVKLKLPVNITYPGHVHDLGYDFWNNYNKTFNLSWSIIISQTSIVETDFNKHFFRTLIAYILKLPNKIELFFNKNKKKIIWNYIGGWEIVLKNNKHGI